MTGVEVDTASLRARLNEASFKALERIGGIETPAIRDSISTRVEVTESGGHYRVTQRSAPGEPPRMETGSLFMGISYEVSFNGDSPPVLNIISARNTPHFTKTVSGANSVEDPRVPQYLNSDEEHGTVNMAARPYMTPAVERIADYALDIFAETFAQEFKDTHE